MKPHVTCMMIASLDGRQHPSRWTESPDGTPGEWHALYEAMHDRAGADAWMVGRTTMAEMSKVQAHPPAAQVPAVRPVHVARRADSYAIAVDRSGKLHFDAGEIGGGHIVVLLGADVPDSHLAELAGDGVSYIVDGGREIDLSAALDLVGEHFGIRRVLLEGGGTINGSLLAAGLVDELHVLMVPALDGRTDAQGIVAHGDHGLQGKTRLSFLGAGPLDHGVVLLRYRVES